MFLADSQCDITVPLFVTIFAGKGSTVLVLWKLAISDPSRSVRDD